MATIWDIAQLRPLETIGRRNKVAFTLRGGVAFRLMLALSKAKGTQPPFDLFDLTPFTSDVDLLHSGSAKLTRRLLDEIQADVPASECFRWELGPAKPRHAFAERVGSNHVPARLVQLTGDVPNGLIDPADGARDIFSGQYRYSRDPLFKLSARYRQGSDLEAFSALLYLQTLAEAALPPSLFPNQPGWQTMKEVFVSGHADSDLIPLLQQHAYLRSRLRHLLRATVTAFPSRDSFRNAATQSGLLAWMQHLTNNDRDAPVVTLDPALRASLCLADHLPEAALATSERLAGDTYRMHVPAEPWTHQAPTGLPMPMLGEGESVLLISPRLTVQPGRAVMSSGSRGELLATPTIAQEFIHMQLPEAPLTTEPLRATLQNTPDTRLGAFLMLLENATERWCPIALPAVVMRRASSGSAPSRLVVRMNCLGLLAGVASNAAVPAHLILVKAPSHEPN